MSRRPRRPSPRNSAADRILRRLALLGYLGNHGPVTFGELGEVFGVPVRTVVTDVFALWTVNGRPGDDTLDYVDFATTLDDDFDPAGPFDEAAVAGERIALLQSQDLDRQIPLSTQETVAMTLGLHQIRELARSLPPEYAPVREAVETASAKIVGARRGAAPVVGAAPAGVRDGAEGHVAPETLATVRDALQGGSRLSLRYVSAADVETEREVDPAALVGEAGTWVLQAWCHLADAPRSFRLDRVREARTLDEAVHRDHVRAVGDRPGTGSFGTDVTHVEVEVRAAALWRVEDVPHEALTATGQGTLLVRVPVAEPAWFAGFLLRLGTHLVAVRPSAAADDAARRAREALRAYEELDTL